MRAIGDDRLRPRHASAVRESDHATAKRRQVLGDRCARDAITLAICRALYPAQYGEPCDLDGWILLHMGDADLLEAIGEGKEWKRARDKRDYFARKVLEAEGPTPVVAP